MIKSLKLSGTILFSQWKKKKLQRWTRYRQLSKSVDFKTMEESPLDRLLTNVNVDSHLYGVSGSSGGYAETIFRYAARALFNSEIEGSIDFKILRNSDFREVSLEVESKPILKFALCYGFKNLQNIVRKIKMGK